MKRLRATARRVIERWKHCTFCQKVGIGVVILLVVAVLESRGLLAGAQHALLDWQIAALKGTSSGDRIAFIDIDESSEASFAQIRDRCARADTSAAAPFAPAAPPPYFTPRDILKKLIEAAVDAGPSVVVVDIDLSQPPPFDEQAGDGDTRDNRKECRCDNGCLPSSCSEAFSDAYREVHGPVPPRGAQAAARERLFKTRADLGRGPCGPAGSVARFFLADWDLDRYLAQHASTCKSETTMPEKCVPIVLARSVSLAPGSLMKGPNGEANTASERVLPSFLDSDLAKSSAGVLWGSVTFDHDDDYVVRRWRLWEPVCDARNLPGALPSAALLATAFQRANGQNAPRPEEPHWPPFLPIDSETQLALHFAPQNCDPQSRSLPVRLATKMEIEGIELKPGELSRRNRYRVSWSDAETSLTTVIPAAALLDDGTRARLSIDCAGQARPAPQDRYCVRGRIVVIGSTYRANGDFHRVPGGEMPGSLVMINMIDSLLRQEHDFDELPMPAAVAFELGLILLLAWLFSHYERWEFMILVLATAGLVVICLPVSFWLLQRDVWFDIAPPLIGMILHEWWLRAEHAWESFMKGAQ